MKIKDGNFVNVSGVCRFPFVGDGEFEGGVWLVDENGWVVEDRVVRDSEDDVFKEVEVSRVAEYEFEECVLF